MELLYRFILEVLNLSTRRIYLLVVLVRSGMVLQKKVGLGLKNLLITIPDYGYV